MMMMMMMMVVVGVHVEWRVGCLLRHVRRARQVWHAPRLGNFGT